MSVLMVYSFNLETIKWHKTLFSECVMQSVIEKNEYTEHLCDNYLFTKGISSPVHVHFEWNINLDTQFPIYSLKSTCRYYVHAVFSYCRPAGVNKESGGFR